ncbi:hypothetical protein D9M68_877860 [compost metagenome]
MPTPTPITTSDASQRSSGSRAISFSPASTSPPIGVSPLVALRSCSRATAHRRRRSWHTTHTIRKPADTSIRLAMPMRSTKVRVRTGPRIAPTVPAAPM